MKQVITILLACAALSLTACGGCNDTTGTNEGANNGNNKSNNTQSNNQMGSCTVGTDCASGRCENGRCVTTGGNNCADPGPCGNCDPTCRRTGTGVGDPFVLEGDPDQTGGGVVLDPDGSITLDVTRIESQFIWISNTGEGTISKVDTRTYEEVARYETGPAGNGNDPSRTSVNTFGDVFVGNRGGRSLTKISSLGEFCPDTNGDGMVTTSTGPTDVLPWGQDDCVMWHVDLPNGGLIRSVAAQDVRPDDDLVQPAVWVGGWDGRVWKLSSDRGDILVETDSPVQNYGFALDGLGNLWISGWTNNAIGRIDTTLCVDNASCNVPVCTGEGPGNDDCVKQSIPMPFRPYGITVDFKQRVWVGGDETARYVFTDAVGSRLTRVSSVFIHGIAADDKGFIWGAGLGSGVIRYDAEDPSQMLAVPQTGLSPKGMAVDLDGKIWAINLSDDSAIVIEPGATLNDNTVSVPVNGLVAPYTYSDMTGSQLRFATDERGFYRRVFEGCALTSSVLETQWNELRWDVSTPGNSKVLFRVRGANTRAELANAEWFAIATVPPDMSPFDLAAALAANGLGSSQFIEIEAALSAERDAADNVIAPKLRAMEVTYSCPIIIQ